MPDPTASPRYYLYSGDVEVNGARVSTAESLSGPWSRRELVTGGGVVGVAVSGTANLLESSLLS